MVFQYGGAGIYRGDGLFYGRACEKEMVDPRSWSDDTCGMFAICGICYERNGIYYQSFYVYFRVFYGLSCGENAAGDLSAESVAEETHLDWGRFVWNCGGDCRRKR